MLYIKYKFNQIEQYIYFDDEYEQFFNYLIERFKAEIVYQKVKEPLVQVYKYTNQINYTNKLGQLGFLDFDKKYKFIFSFLKSKKYIINLMNINVILHCFITSLILKYDFLYLHGMLLNNGDLIMGQCGDGKTTLAMRINNNNQYLKCLSDDYVLIDVKNNLAYPIPYLPFEGQSQFCNIIIDHTKSYKINSIFYLKQDSDEKKIFINKEKWKNKLINCCKSYLYHPFGQKRMNKNISKKEMWVQTIPKLTEIIQNRIEELINHYFSNINPLCITTSNNNINKKFEVIEDKI